MVLMIIATSVQVHHGACSVIHRVIETIDYKTVSRLGLYELVCFSKYGFCKLEAIRCGSRAKFFDLITGPINQKCAMLRVVKLMLLILCDYLEITLSRSFYQ